MIVWKAAAALLDSFFAVLIHHKEIIWCFFNNLIFIVVILDSQAIPLKYSINIVMHGNLALPLVGEIQ